MVGKRGVKTFSYETVSIHLTLLAIIVTPLRVVFCPTLSLFLSRILAKYYLSVHLVYFSLHSLSFLSLPLSLSRRASHSQPMRLPFYSREHLGSGHFTVRRA